MHRWSAVIFWQHGFFVYQISPLRLFFWDFLRDNMLSKSSIYVRSEVQHSAPRRMLDIPADPSDQLWKIWFRDCRTLLIIMGGILSSFNATLLFNIYKTYWVFLCAYIMLIKTYQRIIIRHLSADFCSILFFIINNIISMSSVSFELSVVQIFSPFS